MAQVQLIDVRFEEFAAIVLQFGGDTERTINKRGDDVLAVRVDAVFWVDADIRTRILMGERFGTPCIASPDLSTRRSCVFSGLRA